MWPRFWTPPLQISGYATELFQYLQMFFWGNCEVTAVKGFSRWGKPINFENSVKIISWTASEEERYAEFNCRTFFEIVKQWRTCENYQILPNARLEQIKLISGLRFVYSVVRALQMTPHMTTGRASSNTPLTARGVMLSSSSYFRCRYDNYRFRYFLIGVTVMCRCRLCYFINDKFVLVNFLLRNTSTQT